ncbi:MAG: type II secretion system F family protein [Thermodesulfovibrionales bacterium]
MAKKVNDLTVLKSLYYMMQSGISAHEGASELALKIRDAKMAERLRILSDLMSKEAYTFTQALEQVDICKDYLFLLQIGERTGNLLDTMRDVISSMESINGIRNKIKFSLYYPLGVIILSIVLGFFFVDILKKILLGLSFPGTEQLFAYKMGWFIVKYKVSLYLGYTAFLTVLGFVLLKNLHRIPVIKDLYNQLSIGQAFKVVSVGLNSGLSPSLSFSHAAQVVSGVWRSIFETVASEVAERSMLDVLDEIEQHLSAETYIILKAKIRSGAMSEGFGDVGKDYIKTATGKLDGLSPFVSAIAFMFVAVQIVLVMGPLWSLLISFMGQVGSVKGGGI